MRGEFTRILSREDFLAANWLMLRHRWLWRGVLRFILIVWPIYFLIDVLGGNYVDILAALTASHLVWAALSTLLTTVGVLIAGLIYWRWQMPRLARKRYAQMHLEGMETRYSFDADSFNGADPRGTCHFAWTDFVRWIENERLLLIFPTDGNFVAIPKSQIAPETLDALRAALIAANVPTR